MKQKRKIIISVAAATEGGYQLLVPLIESLDKVCSVSDIEYSTEDGISNVKCRVSFQDDFHILLEIASEDLDLDIRMILNWKSHVQKVVFARDIIAYVLHERCQFSFSKIAALMGAKTHSTIILSSRKFGDALPSLRVCSLEQAYLICKRKHSNYNKIKQGDKK